MAYNKTEKLIGKVHFSNFDTSQKGNMIAESEEKVNGKPVKKLTMVVNEEGRNQMIIRHTNALGIEAREITLVEKPATGTSFGTRRVSNEGVESIFFRAQKGNIVYKGNLYFNANSQRIKVETYEVSDAAEGTESTESKEESIPVEQDVLEDVIAG